MRRWALISIGVAAVAVIASQFVIPELGERAVEARLTEAGGSAEVSISALPALRLLFSDGDELQVSARDLELDVQQRTDVLDRLDGFDSVEVSLTDSLTGPFELHSFDLTRDGNDPYRLVSSGRTSVQALAEYGFDTFGIPGAGLADSLLDRVLGQSDESEVPVELDMELTSDDGRLRVISGGGTIAGFDTGPLAELVTTAIVVRL